MLSWPNGSLPGFGTNSYDYWVRTKKRFVFSTKEIFLTSKAQFDDGTGCLAWCEVPVAESIPAENEFMCR